MIWAAHFNSRRREFVHLFMAGGADGSLPGKIASAAGLPSDRHIESRHTADNKKCEKLLKSNRRNHKEIDRCNAVSMVAKEGFPCLRPSTSPRYHVLRDCRLGDLEAQLQKLTVVMRRTPERVNEAHSSDKLAPLLADPRSTTKRARLPPPERGEAFAMPTHDCLRPGEGYGVKDAWKATIKPNG